MAELKDDRPRAAPAAPIAGVRADLADGVRFLHQMIEPARKDTNEIALTILALVEELLARGDLDAEAYASRLETARAKGLERLEEHHRILIEERTDKYAVTELPPIPCAELIPLCRGRCCTLHFSLTKQDLDERVVRWDYTRPYVIRQRPSDGYCVHNAPESRGCTVYEHRPYICRTYDCREDKRIWIDYDKRIPVVDPALEPIDAPVPHGPPPR